jgi:hypothetical protein
MRHVSKGTAELTKNHCSPSFSPLFLSRIKHHSVFDTVVEARAFWVRQGDVDGWVHLLQECCRARKGTTGTCDRQPPSHYGQPNLCSCHCVLTCPADKCVNVSSRLFPYFRASSLVMRFVITLILLRQKDENANLEGPLLLRLTDFELICKAVESLSR